MDKDFSYVGWIPTVSGRLSFSEFGISTNPTQSITSSFVNGRQRCIITYQKRYLSDTIIPILSYSKEFSEFIDLLLFQKSGKFWIACCAVYSEENDALEGTIGVFDKDAWRGNTERKIRELQSHLPMSYSYKNAEVSILSGLIEKDSLFSAKYRARRNGIFTIDPIKNNLPDESESNSINDDLLLQCYYYIKDNLHTHKHHSERTDSILGLYKPEVMPNWKLDILYSLYRKIISRRRNGSVVDFIDGLGVLSYAESFRCLFKEHFSEIESISLYNRSQMIESLNASLAKADYYEKKKSLNRSYILFSLTLFGIVVSTSSLISISGEEIDSVSPYLIEIAGFIGKNPFKCLATAVVISFVYGLQHNPENSITKDAFFDFKRIISSFNRKIIYLTFFISILLSLITFSFLIVSFLDF